MKDIGDFIKFRCADADIIYKCADEKSSVQNFVMRSGLMFEDYSVSLKLDGSDIAVVTNGLTELKYIMGIGCYFTMVKKRFGNQIDIGCLCKITDNFIKTLNKDYCCVLDSDNTYSCNRSVLIVHDSIFLFNKNIIARGDLWCASLETLCSIDDAQEPWCRFGHDGIKKELEW